MAFLKTAQARVVSPQVSKTEWGNIRTAAKVAQQVGNLSGNLIERATEMFGTDFDPAKYLLTHATIVASVDVYEPTGVKIGSVLEDGFRVNRKYADYRITPETDKLINHNYDSWSRNVLLASYSTFIGGQNFQEHIQLEELSKGRIIDAVARDIGESVYIDILIATDRKHKDLVAAIENGKMSTLSMGCVTDGTICTKCGHWAADETELCPDIKYAKGNTFFDEQGRMHRVAELCFPPSTRVVLADGSRQAIEDIQVGDMVLTHTGQVQPVSKLYHSQYSGELTTLKILGLPQILRSTPNHPYWVISPNEVCACGCGHKLSTRKRFSRNEYFCKWAPGHHPNKGTSLSEPEFSFKEAKDLQIGDLVAFPIPQQIITPKDVNLDRAHLLGWFLAEGSFIKRNGEYTGVQFTLNAADEREEAETLAYLLEKEFEPEIRFGATRAQTQYQPKSVPVAQKVLDFMSNHSPCLARNIQQALGMGRKQVETVLSRYRKEGVLISRKASPEEKGQLDLGGTQIGNANIWILVGDGVCVRSRIGQQAHKRKVEEIAKGYIIKYPHVYQYSRTTEPGEKLQVNYINRVAAQWFLDNAGEYAAHKRLPKDALYWPLEIQKTLLCAYVHGDGGSDNTDRFSVSSISETLISQMQIVAARCGLWSRRLVIFGGKLVDFQSVVNNSAGLPIGSDGYRPRHELHFQPSEDTTEMFSKGHPKHIRGLAPAWRKQNGYLLYRIKEVEKEFYTGPVCNFEVAGDNSYLVEGLAVHNCGHESISPHGGVHFIEASWVGTPAFTGAVLRNVIEPTEEVSKQAAKVLATPPPQWASDANLKAASEAGVKIIKKTFGTKVADEMFLAGWEEGDAAPEEAPPTTEPAKPSDPFDDLEEKVRKHVLERVEKRLTEELAKPENPEGASLNETLNKQATMKYNAGLSAIIKTASSDVDLINRIASFNLKSGIDLPVDLYRASLKVGSRKSYKTAQAFWTACETVLGHKPLVREARILDRLSKLLNLVA
jgi:hypothetical protein